MTGEWLGLDVGGANIKAAHSCGLVRTSAFAVWKEPERLSDALGRLAAEFPPFAQVAVTMTAELCDCFPTKRDGVLRIIEAIEATFPKRPIQYWCTDGRFHNAAGVRDQPLLAAASNWLALATIAAQSVDNHRAILVDVGSTTTDLIPLAEGRVAARARDDLGRLQNGELVYAGAARTPVCALAVELPFQGRSAGLAAEFFATTHDVYLILGDVPPNPNDSATADGRPATRERAVERLARMVCADRDLCTVEDVEALARAADKALRTRLADAARRACVDTIGEPTIAVVSGSGEFLARRVAEDLVGTAGEILALGDLWGPGASEAACAYALIELVRRVDGSDPR